MNPKSRQSIFCTNIRVEQKQTVLYYQPEARRPFLRVGLATPNLVPQTRSEYALASCTACSVPVCRMPAWSLCTHWSTAML